MWWSPTVAGHGIGGIRRLINLCWTRSACCAIFRVDQFYHRSARSKVLDRSQRRIWSAPHDRAVRHRRYGRSALSCTSRADKGPRTEEFTFPTQKASLTPRQVRHACFDRDRSMVPTCQKSGRPYNVGPCSERRSLWRPSPVRTAIAVSL
jgi:hypothetical protein